MNDNEFIIIDFYYNFNMDVGLKMVIMMCLIDVVRLEKEVV